MGQLELILGEIGFGFSFGFLNGIHKDRKMDFRQEQLEYTKELAREANLQKELQELETAEKVIKDAYSRITFYTYTMGGIAATMLNSVVYQKPDQAMAGGLLTALSMYTGTKLGRLVSKLTRKKQKLTLEEKATVDNCLEEIKQHAIQGKKLNTEITSYMEEILHKKKSKEVSDYIHKNTRKAIEEGIQYRKIKGFLDVKFPGALGAMLIKKSQDNSEGCALIPHEGEIYILNLGMKSYRRLKEDSKKRITDIVEPSMDSKKLDWDGTVEGIIKITDEIKDKNTILVNNQDAPLSIKMFLALNAYTDIYEKQNFGEENKND